MSIVSIPNTTFRRSTRGSVLYFQFIRNQSSGNVAKTYLKLGFQRTPIDNKDYIIFPLIRFLKMYMVLAWTINQNLKIQNDLHMVFLPFKKH